MANAVLKTILCCCGWVGLFMACRVGVWFLGGPWWWSVPAMLGFAVVFMAVGWLRSLARKDREDRLHAEPSDPKLSSRIRVAWKRGHEFRKGRVFPPTPEPAWYVCLKMSESMPGELVELGDAASADTADNGDAFTWRRGPGAAWLDFPGGMPDDPTWRSFADMLGRLPRLTPPAGVVLRVDAVRLLENTHATVHTDAPVIRRRLELLQKACRKRLPFYIVVDNLDRLYGLRSLISRMVPDRLFAPLGGLRTNAAKEPSEFIATCIDGCIAALGGPDPEAGPAALQAPDEIRRLEAPLIALAAQLCKTTSKGPFMRGLFLSAAAPGGDGVSPLLARLATFQPLDETLPVQPWFLRTLLRDVIPADAEASRRAAGVPFRFAYPAGALGLLAGSVALCLAMTCSFLESRGVLLSARGRAVAPNVPEKLQPYLELATLTRLRNNGWRLPRFGMNEPEALEEVLRQRYTESYFDLKTVPSIEHVQDAAIAATESNDPVKIGNSLLLLAVTRSGIGRNLPAAAGRDRNARFLHALVEALELATPEDMQQLETYFAWAGRQDWMPETHAALADFEKYVLENAGSGDLSWLPAWIDSLPGLGGLDTGKVWDCSAAKPNPAGLIAPSWTLEGYRIAENLLSALLCDADGNGDWEKKREWILARYRDKALEKWRSASAVLWDDFRSRVPDSKTRELFRDAVRGDDPIARFMLLAGRQLLPMFEGVDDEANPDLRLLRIQAALRRSEQVSADPDGLGGLAGRIARAVGELGTDAGLNDLSRRFRSDGESVPPDAASAAANWQNALRQAGMAMENADANLEAVRAQFQAWNNPGRLNFSGQHAALQEAAEPAGTLHEFFRKTSGTAAWDGLSPLASLDYLRYLAARQAALKLDQMWREQVYQPAQLTSGGESDRLARLTAPGGPLEKFLTGSGAGFWRWDGERLVNSEWNRLDFMFARSFLDFCAVTLRQGGAPGLAKIAMPLQIDAVHVDSGAVERPIEAVVRFESGGKEQAVSFKNYRMKGELVWYLDSAPKAEISFVFPSITARIRFEGQEAVATFIRHLSGGNAVFERDSFPDQRAALERMGISRITLRSSLENGEECIAQLFSRSAVIPESIIAKSSAPEDKPAPTAAFGPLAERPRRHALTLNK